MAMKLYDWENSYNSKKIRAIAFEADVSLTLVPLDMKSGAHKSAEHLARNPNGKVPVLEDGSFCLWESNAICLYLAALDPSRKLLPNEPRQRALVDQWMYWQSNHLSPSLGKIAYERIWKARFNLGPADESAVGAAMPEVERFLNVLDGNLASHAWVAGDLSVADFVLAAAFSSRDEMKLDLGSYKNISAWLGRVESRPSWKNSQTWK